MDAYGFDLRLRAPERLISVEDYRRAARRRLPQMVWTYVDGGADDLVTRDANRSAFARWSLVPRVLTGYDSHDLSTIVAGAAAAVLGAVVQIAPVAAHLPRWLTLGTLGIVLLVVGARYESRWRDVVALKGRLAGFR